MNEQITGALFKQMVLHGAAAITLQKQQINDLNVFPVPDGDTGTNMSLTIGAAAAELRKSEPAAVGQAAATAAGALLRGARGNSGVILSLLFRGLSKTLKGCDEADGPLLAAAMQEGVAAAYGAVMKPAEGTVLTVSRLAAKRAVEAAAENSEVEHVLAEAIRVGYEVLAQTTDMNPVLKKAGVVDAGGQGYLVILEGMLAALRGEPMPEMDEESAPKQPKADFNAFSAEEITSAGGRKAELDEVMRESDFVSINVSLLPSTRDLIGRRELALMKPTAFLINCSRGGIVNEEDLIEALEKKRIAGAGLDTFTREPLPKDSPFCRLDNVIMTPHAAWYTVEAMGDVQRVAAEQVALVLTGQKPTRCVNYEEANKYKNRRTQWNRRR